MMESKMCDRDLSKALIESVKMYPCLWDPTTKTYWDRMKKEKAWVSILESLRKTWSELAVDAIKKTWKKLHN